MLLDLQVYSGMIWRKKALLLQYLYGLFWASDIALSLFLKALIFLWWQYSTTLSSSRASHEQND